MWKYINICDKIYIAILEQSNIVDIMMDRKENIRTSRGVSR